MKLSPARLAGGLVLLILAAAIGAVLLAPPGWPTAAEIVEVLMLRRYNTRVVVLGVTALGMASGLIGAFMLLRKRSLMGDAVSHATLPGIGLAFLVMVYAGGEGKWLPGLLLGALLSGVAGMAAIVAIRKLTKLQEDAALGIVLSVSFGLGVAILRLAQDTPQGAAAGLESFIQGKTASMSAADFQLIGAAAIGVTIVCVLLHKELAMLCFDEDYAQSQGWPTFWLDTVMMTLVVAATVIGLQAVGLILIVALLIIPAASARFWTDRLTPMLVLSALFGGASGYLGAGLSALVRNLPSGAIIVVVAATLFVCSMVLGSSRGLGVRLLRRFRLSRSILRQNLMRALWECGEHAVDESPGVSLEELLPRRSWSKRQLLTALSRAEHEGIVYRGSDQRYHLTASGRHVAGRCVRNHRLWELYLITHADVAPGRVDREADQIEHVLGQELVDKLQRLLLTESPALVVPPSPHPVTVSKEWPD